MYPKQFIRFFNGQQPSFLGATLKRLTVESGFGEPILLCNNDHRFLVKEELERAAVTSKSIYLEPIARNTAAAIAVAAFAVARENPSGILVVMPSDHVIRDEARFLEAVRRAAKVAQTGRLVLFGIKPVEAHTGYGYIRQGGALEGFNGGAFAVDAFFEKPDIETARRYVAAGTYYWNSGIFVLGARAFLEELQRLEPRIFEAARPGLSPPRPGRLRQVPEHLDRLCRHGEDAARRHAADRCRLERRRLMVLALGHRAA
jgi:mannose-1-phosphate guanylyltransferase/mannose-6-phosphate isomerase